MRTVLHDTHCALGAKIVEFAGWEMPVYYSGVISEHLAVRQAAGLFDVSHMGRVSIKGPEAALFLDYLSTNKILEKKDLSATYTVWCNDRGGCVDDVIVYREDAQHFFAIVNAGNRQKDLLHLQEQAKNFKVQIISHFDEEGILALQGPLAEQIISEIFPSAHLIKSMHFALVLYKQNSVILSRTGYTGSGGFEIYAPLTLIPDLWNDLYQKGKAVGLVPVGLAARDTLRLEMGYALYGHEIDEMIAPTESVSAWTVKWEKGDFIGKEALKKLEMQLSKRSEYGIELVDKGIARQGYAVFKEGERIGTVTSGTFGPSLKKSIAIVLVTGHLALGDAVEVQIRDHRVGGHVVRIPFLQ